MKRALILHGGWSGHHPEAFARWTRDVLEREGWSAVLADSLAVLADEDLTRFDLIVPMWTMGELPAEGEEALLAAVRGGVGLAGWHGGMGDAFRGSPAYQFMVGGQFVAHPGGIREYRVDIAPGGHPVTEGLEPFRITSEQYYMHVDPGNRVLATTTFDGAEHPWVRGCVMPVAWTRSWGEGRVFYLSIGHDPAEFEIPQVAAMARRGLLWAGR